MESRQKVSDAAYNHCTRALVLPERGQYHSDVARAALGREGLEPPLAPL